MSIQNNNRRTTLQTPLKHIKTISKLGEQQFAIFNANKKKVSI